MTQLFIQNQRSLTKVAGICGILIPVVVFTCISLAILSSPWFTWTQHALSDLGVKEQSPFFFNIGMILGGLFGIFFSLGLLRVLSNKIGAFLLLVSSIALIGIGLFPETVVTLHFLTSAAFFIFITVAFLVLGLTIKHNQFERSVGVLALVFAVVALMSTVLLIPLDGIAITEALCCFPAFVWCMVVGIKMTVN